MLVFVQSQICKVLAARWGKVLAAHNKERDNEFWSDFNFKVKNFNPFILNAPFLYPLKTSG